jgi:hypothetical protein
LSDIENVFDAIQRGTGVDPRLVRDEAVRWHLFNGAVRVVTKPAWERPKEIEAELEGILSDIRALKKRIRSADRHAVVLARQEATKKEKDDFERAIIEAKGDRTLNDKLSREYMQAMAEITPDRYVDRAAIKHLEEVERCFVRPIEVAIKAGPQGRGRPKNQHAHQMAEFAAEAFMLLTGEKPTYWNGTENAFSAMVSELFSIGGILADIRKPIEAAMSKLGQEAGI